MFRRGCVLRSGVAWFLVLVPQRAQSGRTASAIEMAAVAVVVMHAVELGDHVKAEGYQKTAVSIKSCYV
jgi:hypothetical protein